MRTSTWTDISIDDPYDPAQLVSPRMNVAVVRPLVDNLYDPDDASIGRSSDRPAVFPFK